MPLHIEDFREMLEQYERMEQALQKFIDAVDNTGGVQTDDTGNVIPLTSPTNLELGDAYIEACYALDVDPLEEEEQE